MMNMATNQDQFTVCLSHDVDRVKKTFQYVTHFFKAIKNRNISLAFYHLKSLFYKDHYWCFEKIMEVEKSYGVFSTFFFLEESYPFRFLDLESYRLSLGYYDLINPRVVDAIKKLDSSGWEIGLHGSYRSYKDIGLLKKEKGDLEDIVGHKVDGIRQHYLNLNDNTWKWHTEAGFKYDASFGFTDKIGFKDDRYQIFKPFSDNIFIVVPLAIMDSCLMTTENPYEEARKIIELAHEKKAALVLNWHQRVFNQIEFPEYQALYKFIIEKCKQKKANFMTIGELVKRK